MAKTNYIIHQAYEEEAENLDVDTITTSVSVYCPHCSSAWCKCFKNSGSLGGRDFIEDASFTHCDHCGRFHIRRSGQYCLNSAGGNWPTSSKSNTRYRSIIKKFALTDNRIPIETLRQHLIKHYSNVRDISPKQAEELTRSVFREHYKDAEVRYYCGDAYTPDGGIDIVVINPNTEPIGIQVKRRISRQTEPVMEIRSFVASLFEKGLRNGVYVALASGFSKEGKRIAENNNLKGMGLSLRLIDSDAFFDMLKSVSFRNGDPPWYSMLKNYKGFTDDPYIQSLLDRHWGENRDSYLWMDGIV